MLDPTELHRLTATQHALVSTQQLHALGLTSRMIDHRVHRGQLERLHRGVYRLPGSVPTFEQRTLAACLAMSGLRAASHRTAARLWGVDPGIDTDGIEVVTTGLGSDGLPGVVVHRSIDLSVDQVVVRRGVPVTTPLRLLVDLGAVAPTFAVENTLDDLVGRRLVSVVAVRATLDALAARGRSGCGVLREVLDGRTGAELTIGRSRLESRLAELCRRAGIGGLTFQHPVVVGGRQRRLDFAVVELRLAIEVDGYQFHSHFDVFQDDRVRANELHLAGWTVLRFTWHQVTNRPDYVIRILRQAISLAA
jgi:very-short-patch-repair endonuclease